MLNTDRVNRCASLSSIRLVMALATPILAAILAACGGAFHKSSTNSGGGSSSGGGDFEGVVVMKSQSGTERVSIEGTKTYYLKGTHARIEGKSDMGPLGRRETIVLEDFDSGKVVAVYPDKKQYLTMGLGQFAGAADTDEDEYTLTATGQKETIAGYSCDDWHLNIKGENAETVDICVAKGLGTVMSGFAKFFNPKARAKLEANPNWREFFGGGVFPLKLKIADSDGRTLLNDVATSIERKKLDESLFETPPDYTEMKRPGFPGN